VSTFSGINTALTALRAHRHGLELAGQNIANVNTEGYSRQRVELTALGGGAPARYAVPSTSAGGVTVTTVTRVRDEYLDVRARTEHERQSALAGRYEVLADVELAFDEPSDTGLQARLDVLWDGFGDVADHPDDPAARTQLLMRATAVTDGLRTAATQLADQYAGRRGELDATLAEVGTAARRLAALNDAVTRAEQAGANANELHDQRDLLVTRLVELTGAGVSRGANGSIDLRLGTTALVSGTTSATLVATGAATLAAQAGDPVTVRWADGPGAGGPVGALGGRLGALTGALGATLPSYATALDGVAAALATTVNTVHAQGFTGAGAPGGAFFSGSTAADLTVAVTDPASVAASSAANRPLDGGNADRLAALATAPGGAAQVYRNLIGRLGTDVGTARQLAESQDSVTEHVDAARLAASGVNLDEELTSLLTFQRSYEAASRVLTTVDSLLDTLINRMGA
jgi:flagellar hook-associated protein 1